jgi:RND family efflux transporter MFP subunit
MQLKLEKIPVFVIRGLTSSQIRDYRTADIHGSPAPDWFYTVLSTWNFEFDDFVEGAIVSEGTPLFIIEPQVYQARLAQAMAVREQARAKLKLTQADFERASSLFQKGAITQQELDTRAAERDAAQAELMRGEADVREAEIQLGYTNVTAPFDGRVGRRLVDFGNLVGAGQATVLTTIERIKPMYAYFDVDERVVLKVQRWRAANPDKVGRGEVKEGDDEEIRVFLALADEKDFPHAGCLDYLDNAVDPNTGTALIRGVFANENALLYPGLFVRLRIPGEVMQGALMVDERAVGTDLEGKYLLLVGEDNLVEKRKVEAGPLIDGMRVIRGGLEAGDRYILKGLQRARPELPVAPTEVPTVTPASAASATPEAKPEAAADPKPPASEDVSGASAKPAG